ncbi:MAG: Ig-like domain-containing protein [Gammaproteobacteria bacterium]
MFRSNPLSRWIIPAAVLCLATLAGCGGDNSITDPGSGTGLPPPVPVSDLTLLASSPQLPSNGASPATISAIVRDNNNNVVEGASVVFSADSGALTVDFSTTNSDGVAVATLATAGDPTNRDITVGATTGGLNSTLVISVTGTTLVLTGPPNVVFGDTATYTISLRDSGGAGIPGRTVDVSSSGGNTLSANSLVTNSQGEATFQLTATVSGVDTLAAAALGLSATLDATISNDSFAFLVPAADTEVNLGVDETITVEWLINGVPQAGTVNFASTRGTLSAASAPLDANGRATVTINSTNSGPAVISASVAGGPSTQRSIEFVATTAAKIDLQASSFTVGPGEDSTITATVRDVNDNLVKNKVVTFVLDDVTGGRISVGAGVTNSSGQATTVYTAGQTTSAVGGVQITGVVQDTPTVTDQVALTVAQREVFISIGTGNQISEPTTATYLKEFAVQVTDSQGVGVDGAEVQMSVFSKQYFKGEYVADFINEVWVATVSATCQDEDTLIPATARNGILDPGEDFNNSGNIEAGNVATVSPGTVVTDENGFGLVRMTYAQEFGNWVEVTIEAKASVTGTEFLESQDYRLEVLRSDVDLDQSPPGGIISRWGRDPTCATLN